MSAEAHENHSATAPPCEEDENPTISTAPAGNEEDTFAGETFTMSSTLLEALLLMGFSENAIKKSIAAGCINEDTCTQWIGMHQGHPELDTPLDANVRVVVKVAKVLTAEEKAAKAAELKEFIRVKKAQEAVHLAQQEREAEKKRIEMGKHVLEAKEQRESAQRALLAEERRKEKEADARAREKIQIELAIDKYTRQGKTPEQAKATALEELEERKKRARDEAAERLKALQSSSASAPQGSSGDGGSSATSSAWNLERVLGVMAQPTTSATDTLSSVFQEPTIPPPTVESFTELLASISKEAASPEAASTCIATIKTILSNIVDAPFDNKKRTLKASSNVFRTRISPYPSAVRLLRAVNFELTPDAEGELFVSLSSVVLRYLHRALEALSKN
ncbi:Hypothetical protein, putative [Bodo saltans]|uniref:PUB domain-containing protein n=1 Tax=Bodo saltans TaxID=75058 RepID=A0A0S4JLL2_BODSA|nr:Hypothetical protein, putative [Bodo saltans]|eukprot:CUG91274.1 Hypothetical protein, putative [Bodo saltans]